MKSKYLEFLKKNIDVQNKTIVVLGATGSIGSNIASYLIKLKANVILVGQNEQNLKKLQDQLSSKTPVKAPYFLVNFTSKESINELLEHLKNIDIYAIINTIGVYHIPTKMIGAYDETYLINFLNNIYFVNEFYKTDSHKLTKIINTGSISYCYSSIKIDDIQFLNSNNKTKHYGNTKRLLMLYSHYLKENGYPVELAHPGISTTNLFNKKHKGYAKIFYVLIVPLMKIIFMKPNKACLPLLLALNNKPLNNNEWYGPNGLFHSWGYPKIQKYHIKEIENQNLYHQIIGEINKELTTL
jgi:short-subunit dehydrogenase